jgi:hypothetical protein
MPTSTEPRTKAISNVTGRVARRASAGAAALALWLAVPPLAVAGSVNYFGPIDQPGNTESPSVYLKVGTKNKKPVELRRFTAYEPAAQPCPASDELHFPQVKFPNELLPLPIRKGSFSGRAESPDGDFFEISGQVPRKGPARGTLRLTSTLSVPDPLPPPPPPDPEEEERFHEQATCDTGVLSWEAPVYNKPY